MSQEPAGEALTDIPTAFRKWWHELTGKGDPMRRSGIVLEAFEAGWRAALASPGAAPPAPVAWRDHVEQRLHSWRQRFVNRSGDQLALDDFMDKESLDDLLDFVLDEGAHPPESSAPTPGVVSSEPSASGKKPEAAGAVWIDAPTGERPCTVCGGSGWVPER